MSPRIGSYVPDLTIHLENAHDTCRRSVLSLGKHPLHDDIIAARYVCSTDPSFPFLDAPCGRARVLYPPGGVRSLRHLAQQTFCARQEQVVAAQRGTPEMEDAGVKSLAIVNLECIARAAHLLPVYGSAMLPEDFHFSH
ncbi:hypothetical protein DFH09DRAFT_935186 [Mycena vulgaris]|nr:hypothetical protein DFH09DRAFT_935186 [Mycena vulgaris]